MSATNFWQISKMCATCKAYGNDYLLRIYFFSLILEGFQNTCTVQNQPNLFVLVIELQQHVLNLMGRQVKKERKKKTWSLHINPDQACHIMPTILLLIVYVQTCLLKISLGQASVPIHQLCFLGFDSAIL